MHLQKLCVASGVSALSCAWPPPRQLESRRGAATALALFGLAPTKQGSPLMDFYRPAIRRKQRPGNARVGRHRDGRGHLKGRRYLACGTHPPLQITDAVETRITVSGAPKQDAYNTRAAGCSMLDSTSCSGRVKRGTCRVLLPLCKGSQCLCNTRLLMAAARRRPNGRRDGRRIINYRSDRRDSRV